MAESVNPAAVCQCCQSPGNGVFSLVTVAGHRLESTSAVMDSDKGFPRHQNERGNDEPGNPTGECWHLSLRRHTAQILHSRPLMVYGEKQTNKIKIWSQKRDNEDICVTYVKPIRHGGAVVSMAASQPEGSGFKPRLGQGWWLGWVASTQKIGYCFWPRSWVILTTMLGYCNPKVGSKTTNQFSGLK